MQAVQTSFPHQIGAANRVGQSWQPVQPRSSGMGWAPVRHRVGQQVSIPERARTASAMMVGIAAGVSGAILTFSGGKDKPQPVWRGIGWAVLGLGVLVIGVNWFRPYGASDVASR